MEWLWRMSTDPQRLVKRYAKDFGYLVSQGSQHARLMRRKKKLAKSVTSKRSADAVEETLNVEQITWRGDVDASRVDKIAKPEDWDRPIVILCEEVSFIDSSGLGVLAGIARKAREHGVPFVLLRPSQGIVDLLTSMRLERQMPWVKSQSALDQFLQEQKESFSSEKRFPDIKTIQVSPLYSLEKKKADAFADEMYKRLETTKRSWTLLINMRGVDFVDSYGIAKLVTLKKDCLKKGVYLWTEGHQAHVLHDQAPTSRPFVYQKTIGYARFTLSRNGSRRPLRSRALCDRTCTFFNRERAGNRIVFGWAQRRP